MYGGGIGNELRGIWTGGISYSCLYSGLDYYYQEDNKGPG